LTDRAGYAKLVTVNEATQSGEHDMNNPKQYIIEQLQSRGIDAQDCGDSIVTPACVAYPQDNMIRVVSASGAALVPALSDAIVNYIANVNECPAPAVAAEERATRTWDIVRVVAGALAALFAPFVALAR
jgi:hypothetical protein